MLVGFTNDVYLVNNKYILKICKNKKNEPNFEKEAYFYNLFKGKLLVPNLLFYDNSKKNYNRDFMVYYYINGVNLYSLWHLLSVAERKNIVKQLCDMLKIINNTSYKEYVKKFKHKEVSWKKEIFSKIKKSIFEIEKRKLLSKDIIEKLTGFIKENISNLDEQKMALVYWDAHFDNILVSNNKIVGLLDFERTKLASVDFVLDIVSRMVSQPKKYMSKSGEKYAKKKDYAKLLVWYEEFYPELFMFDNLDKRLLLYSIGHDLAELLDWPKSESIKKKLMKSISYGG